MSEPRSPSTSAPGPQPQIKSDTASSDRGWMVPTAMIIVGAAAFAAIAGDVSYNGWLVRNERVVNAYLHQHADPVSVWIFSAISGMGQFVVMLGLTVVVGTYLAMRRRWREVTGWLVAMVGSGILNATLKNYFQVPRPSGNTFFVFDEVAARQFSFPSGHTMSVTIAAGTLAILAVRLWPVSPRRRAMLAVGVVFLALLEAFALVYMGVHYMSDVAGGLAISLAWLGVIRMILPAPERIPVIPISPQGV